MPDTDTSASVTESPAVDTTSQVVGNKAMEFPKMPNDPANLHSKDSNAAKRAARLAALTEQVESESEKRVTKRILGETDDTDTGGDDEEHTAKEAGAGAGKKTDPKADAAAEEKRREERRKATAKANGEAVEDDEPTTATATETAAAEEAAAEEDKPEANPEDASEKARREKFQKVLKMEAQARAKDEKLRAREDGLRRLENDLQAKSRTLEENYKRLVARNERDVQTAAQVLKLARESPLELLERAGAKPEDVARWIEQASDPVQQRLKQYDQRFAEMERREVELKRREEAARQQQQQIQQRQQVEKAFLDHFEEQDGEDYVFEAARLIFSPAERIRLGDEIATAAHQRGMTFTHRDIAEAVDAEAREDERYKALQKRLAKQAGSVAPKTETKPAVKTAASVSRSSGVVANNTVAQQGGAAPKPAGGPAGTRKLSPKEQRDLRNRRLIAGLDRE